MAESEEEVDVLVQRVVKDINNAFKKNPNIDEIGLIPCPEARYNRSPIVLVENKLGVESWCVKFLLPYVHNKLLLFRQRKQWLDRDDQEYFYDVQPSQNISVAALIDITCTLLLLNPDFTTAWNVRKELVQCGALNPEKDLYLGKLALTKFPKSPETWIHRRWVLQRVLQECCPQGAGCKEQGEADRPAQAERLQRVLQEEMKVCSEAAGRYPSNYNAWSHRIWVLQHLAKGNIKILHDELSCVKYWVSMHVSDHSGFHYRQFLLKSLVGDPSIVLDKDTLSLAVSSPDEHCASLSKGEGVSVETQRTAVPDLFDEEMQLCTDLIESYPGHETLWCHRRHIFFLWHHWNKEHYRGCGQASVLKSSDGTLNNTLSETTGGKTAQDMDVDVVLDAGKQGYTQETKRLKRGPLQDCHGLPSEHRFIAKVLNDCRSTEQSRISMRCIGLLYHFDCH
ncbi:protein prenyltransferase alpha subunit repeat-containing protein 1 isoform X2 [Amia ocellicauda]|uniref:protein prenyltransferase alpha subunit repeat-containing protein 1 isoform X2 n=1 Tax=Amia ocellicauda TaxID=2972642 RepID=UPI003464544F